jgi:TorA maturation chaperone TorD
MNASIDLDAPGLRDLLLKAVEFRLIGVLFERPRPGRRLRIVDLAQEASDPELRAIAARMADLDETTYVSLFGPGGPVSPREVSYRRAEDPGWILAEARTYYEAFGYRPCAEDPADHVAVVVGFAAWLALKELYLRARGEDPEVAAEARAAFVKTHVAPLAAGLASRLEAVAAPDLLDLAKLLAARTDAAPAPADAPEPPDDGGFSCGPCGGETPRP